MMSKNANARPKKSKNQVKLDTDAAVDAPNKPTSIKEEAKNR